ncbi:hypothetical protein [Streptomyces sp.]|uniref:hypothetical protein n=1 Tax=Streptomyces sp. TaxID=1931 RepID=UPI002D78C586|nr:hypothetical protein [Streptomyces sp.]HET6359565.1 hypothetical protein [Streptomyces sp.]
MATVQDRRASAAQVLAQRGPVDGHVAPLEQLYELDVLPVRGAQPVVIVRESGRPMRC